MDASRSTNKFSLLSDCTLGAGIDMFAPLEQNTPTDENTETEKIASTPTPQNLTSPERIYLRSATTRSDVSLKVQLQTLDTGLNISATALLDSGAMGMFIDSEFVKRHQIPTRPLEQAVRVYNVDGTRNESGSIREIAELRMQYRDHSEKAIFSVIGLGRDPVIIGHTWLVEHNPEIDWITGKVEMTRCPSECGIHKTPRSRNRRAFRKARKLSLLPALPQDDDAPESAAEGRIFVVMMHPESKVIAATATHSQRLALEAESSAPKRSFEELVPPPYHDFRPTFAKESFDELPRRKVWDHAIELKTEYTPRSTKIYPLSPSEQVELDKFIEENLRSGRIRPSKSPQAAPVFFIKKKDGSLRLVQDYRKLNEMTIKNAYPLPLISDVLDRLHDAKIFSKLDLRWGYNNVRIREGDEWKAAFRTNRGLFEPLVMFFGLTNSPATFQTMMNDLLRDLIDQGVVIVYMDDILVFNKTLEEHCQTVRRILEIIAENELYLKPEKCEFEKSRIDYLGLIISAGQVEMDPTKVRGVADWPKPKTVKEVQSFLGFINFYRRFIHDFARVARPLHELTRKTVVWNWTSKEQAAFEELKGLVMSTPILVFPREDKPFLLEADASDFATGAVLSQEGSDGKLHPVGYMSRSLSAVERNYEIHDKEMLAIMRGLEEWRHFLEGAKCKFEIITDHKNLEYFRSAQKLNRRQARWSLYLSRFDFTLTHKPGKTMLKVDSLSRRADHGRGHLDNADIVLLQPELFRIRALEATVSDVRALGDKFLVRIRETEDRDEAVVKAVKELRASAGLGLRNAEWEEEDGIVLFRGRIYVPLDSKLRHDIVAAHHDGPIVGHPGRWKTTETVARNYWWPGMTRYIAKYVAGCDRCN